MADITLGTVTPGIIARAPHILVMTSATVGYVFVVESAGSTLSYRKTSDGGANWGADVTVFANLPVSYDVWFDQWTPGDSGTKIHIWHFDVSSDDVSYRSLDTNGDTLGTAQVIFAGATAVIGRGSFVSGTKTRSGYLYAAFDIDNGTERGFYRSTDSGTSWGTNLSTTFVEAAGDDCRLFPSTGTGDDNDCWAIYQDADADALTMKMWDSSAASAIESSTFQAMIELTTDGTGPGGYAGSVRHSDGDIIVVSCSEYDTATADMVCFEVSAVNSGSLTGIATKGNITTNIDDCYYPGVFINQSNGDIYVSYNGKRDGSEVMATTTKGYYTKSTDGGATWSAGDTAYTETAAGINQQTYTPMMGLRWIFILRNATNLRTNVVNALTFTAGPLTQSMTAALSFVGADAFRTNKGMTAAITFAGAAAKRMSRGIAGTLTSSGTLSATRFVVKALTATLSFVGAQTKRSGKAMAGSLSFVGATSKRLARGLAGALSFVGTARKTSGKAFAGALTFAGTIKRAVAHKMTAALTWGGNFATQLVGGPIQFTKSLVASLSFSTAQAKFTRKGMAGALSFVGAAAKRGTRALAGALAFVGSMAAKNVFTRAFTATLSFIGAQSKRIPMRLESALSFVGNVVGGIIGLGGIFRNRRGSRGVNA